MRQTKAIRALAAFVGAALLWAGPAAAQTVKVGFIGTYSGPGAPQGDQFDKGLKLFMKLNGDKLPPGVKVELIVRDDTGPNPDNGKRVAQELIVRDKVQFITGVIWTPNARAIAPLTAEAKVPFISANAAGVDVPYMSPYFARVSFTLWQSCYPLGQWAAKKYKRVYTAVSDFAPGHEAEEAFIKAFKEGGGEIVASVRISLANPDFVPYMQRVKDAKPEAVFSFIPADKKEYGEKLYPGFLVVGAYDAMEAIFHVIREQKGKIDPDKTMELLKQYKNPNSPRGPIAIDPDTRDVVQNEYLREVRKVGGQLANVEIETLATTLKDPWKEFNKKK